MTPKGWPPPIGSTVCGPTGELCEVVAHFDGDGHGEYIVLKRAIPGGWRTQLVTRAEWRDGGFTIVGS